MARIARVVVPGIPHHITQRGNRRMETFFSDADYREYLYLMAEWCNRCKVQVLSYCLMPNQARYPRKNTKQSFAMKEAAARLAPMIFLDGWKN